MHVIHKSSASSYDIAMLLLSHLPTHKPNHTICKHVARSHDMLLLSHLQAWRQVIVCVVVESFTSSYVRHTSADVVSNSATISLLIHPPTHTTRYIICRSGDSSAAMSTGVSVAYCASESATRMSNSNHTPKRR